MSSFSGCLYFIVSNYVLYFNLKTLYKLIRENDKLIIEMKRLLQVFPESVIIRADDVTNTKKKKYFANHQFSVNICDIQKEINRINSIQCIVRPDTVRKSHAKTINISLQNLLKQQEGKIKDCSKIEYTNIQMKLTDTDNSTSVNFESEKSDEPSTKYFTVKTLKVSWEGNTNAFLHVFVDVTDIRKLEEANNSIKLQKIMFASVSHEF